MADELHRFMFQAAPVRGGMIQLKDTWREILSRRDYPAPVRELLGQMTSAAALLTASLKFEGSMIMQIHGDGPVRLLVVECPSNLDMRATATLAEDAHIAEDASLTDMLNAEGRGCFAITLDPQRKTPGQQPYQGIVPLSDENGPLTSMAAVLEQYMRSSEQIEARIWLAADAQSAGGLLLQKMPDAGGKAGSLPRKVDADAWGRVCHLGATLGIDELLKVDTETVLHRLFLQESEEHGVRLFPPQRANFRCACSRAKVGGMLRMLGQPEVESILEERGLVDVQCEFCGQGYTFDPVDCRQLFASQILTEGIRSAPTRRQ
ncbi:MAG: Hsp33 family molecular chaperone HslO [Candidatus Protistobacter heckmanni]|nr:Hsp33 family molecular chaperone HslO [Candidatus Protistobacter heckmanni]